MTKEEFKNVLQVGDIIYNAEKEVIVTVSSSYIRGQRTGFGFVKSGHYMLNENDIDNWHFHDENSPLFVKFEVLKRDFEKLEKFIDDRLK